MKKKKPIIGILGVPTLDDENDNVIALYADYKNMVIKKGGIPFMICPLSDIDYYHTKVSEVPNLTEKEKENYRYMIDFCDGLIIPGGYRIYNFDYFVTQYAIEKDIPTLGICRGMQILANIDNGGNCLIINETEIDHRQRGEKYVHNVQVMDDTLLKRITGKEKISVNSVHRYHVLKTNQFKISAYSEDGLIEGIEHPTKRFVVGVQWHPEKMINYDENANKILDYFIDECVKSKKNDEIIEIL